MDEQLHSSLVFENEAVVRKLPPTAQNPLSMAYNSCQGLTFPSYFLRSCAHSINILHRSRTSARPETHPCAPALRSSSEETSSAASACKSILWSSYMCQVAAHKLIMAWVKPDSSVGVVTRLLALCSAGVRDLLRTPPPQVSNSMVNGYSFLEGGIDRPECEANNSYPFSADIKHYKTTTPTTLNASVWRRYGVACTNCSNL
jgi:hypothetical protein